MMDNFKFLALQYLNDWCSDDSRFVAGLSTSRPGARRLACLQEAAKYYVVIRNFKKSNEERLQAALQALDEIDTRVEPENVDLLVDQLATNFKRLYHGGFLISAASKFLWIRHKSPFVIYDTRAASCLRHYLGGKFPDRDYKSYRLEWLRRYAEREDSIRTACAELFRAKDFSHASTMPDEEFAQLTEARWFHERVFDKFLWWNPKRPTPR